MTVLPTPVLITNSSDILSNPGVPNDFGLLSRSPVSNGTTSNLIIDGSATPEIFRYTANKTRDIVLSEFRILTIARTIEFDGTRFMGDIALVNGIRFEISDQWGVSQIAQVKINEDFLLFPSKEGIMVNLNGSNDIMLISFDLSNKIVLRAGTSDEFRVVINDNLTKPGYQFKFCQCYVYGVKES